ncbi:MAG: glutathione S-transferase [Algicola sp.]|nr:glutathione S-transferase [Algicola sp.]
MSLPVLYSLQHCPYAMRARMGLLLAKQAVLIRAIVLKDKPAELLVASPKGTVPVLIVKEIVNKALLIEESLEIMLWALAQNDPNNLLYSEDPDALPAMLSLNHTSDTTFRDWLKKYKCAARYHDEAEVEYRQHCETFVGDLEQRLTTHKYLMGDTLSFADYAILPFIRQFAKVDRKWYLQAPYPKLHQWLNNHLQSPLFSKTMAKYPLWLESREDCLFGAK